MVKELRGLWWKLNQSVDSIDNTDSNAEHDEFYRNWAVRHVQLEFPLKFKLRQK